MQKEKIAEDFKKTFSQGQKERALIRELILKSVPPEKLEETKDVLLDYGKNENDVQAAEKLFAEKSEKFLKKFFEDFCCNDQNVIKTIRTSDESTWNNFISALRKTEKEFFNKFVFNLLSFDDIVNLDDIDVQKMLRETDISDLAKALNYSSGEIQEKIFNNISPQAREELKGLMVYYKKAGYGERFSEKSKNKMLSTICRLAFCGDAVLKYPSK